MEKFLKRTAVPGSSSAAAHRTVNAGTTEVEIGQKQIRGVNISMRSTRANIENTKQLLNIAKLFDVKGEVQQIEFSSPLLSGDYRLIEVDPKLADRIESGERLVFRGELDDNAVLCTKQETYQVKEAETSNTFLVLPAVHFANEIGGGDHFLTSRKVVAMHSGYVELRKLDVVSLNRLKELLRENELDWDESENPEQEGKSYTLDDLLDVVQMSEEQLMNALHHLPVIHQHGYIRMLSSSYRDRLLMELTECCDDEDEPLIEVKSICIEAFSEAVARRNPTRSVPSEAIRWLINTHCSRIIDDDGKERFALDDRAVCRSKASQLLRAAVRFEYSAFEKLLRQMLPEGIEMKDEYLNGLALVDDSLTRGKTIRYANIEDMPDDEYKRLQLLFSIRPKWKLTEIEHFLTDLCPTSRATSEMLAKYCRHSTVGGERYVVALK